MKALVLIALLLSTFRAAYGQAEYLTVTNAIPFGREPRIEIRRVVYIAEEWDGLGYSMQFYSSRPSGNWVKWKPHSWAWGGYWTVDKIALHADCDIIGRLQALP